MRGQFYQFGFIMPLHFRFRLYNTGELLGIIECDHPSEQGDALRAAGYSWECPWHGHRNRPLSLNWLHDAAEFPALVSQYAGLASQSPKK
jgi:hypothetical protein